jgi:hypothetical protein
MRQRDESEPEEARRNRRLAVLKRLTATLKSLKTELEGSKMLGANVLREISALIGKIEAEIE